MQLIYTLNIIDDTIKIFTNIGNFFWNMILKIIDTITMIFQFIQDLSSWILKFFSILPNDIASLLIFLISILTALLIYKFIR